LGKKYIRKNNMKILITGHKGFIGQNLYEYLKEDHKISTYEWYPYEYPEVYGYDWVIHLGAISSTTEQNVDKVMTQNYEFSQWIFNECNNKKVNLQYSSSASVYGNNTSFNEDDPKQPQSPYAWSKYLFDRWVTRQPKNIVVQGFRYFNVYGPKEDHKKDQASPYTKFIKQAKEEKIITLFKNSDKYKRDFVCVEDVCEAHKQMLNIKTSDIYNIGTGKAISFYDVANTIANKYNAKIYEIDMPSNLIKQYQKFTQADLTNLNKHVKINWINILDYIKRDS